MNHKKIPIRSEKDIILARQAGREVANQFGFGTADQTRLATAISELTRNVIQFAKKGECVISTSQSHNRRIVRVVVEDHGPGIADVEQAMKRGYSTAHGLGAGLPGTRRLVHTFKIESKPGHTRITIEMIRRTK